ncbi:phage portal protein [Clostridium tyrobutyricum]|nr:phage portal protein [Clostridium tyrobutyricum]
MGYLGINSDDLQVRGKNAMKEVVLYTCIKILSETMGKLPFKIYQDNNGTQKATGHYLYQLLKLRPNPYMSAFSFWSCVETLRNIYGNSYVLLDFVQNGRNAGKIQGFYPLDPTKMTIWIDDIGLLSSKNSIWYVYTDNMGNQYKLKNTDLLHFKSLTYDGILGISPIKMLQNSIENSKASQKFLNKSFKNGMQSAGIVNYVGELSPKAEDTFRDNFERMSSGLNNANRISLLPVGYQYQPLALKLVDAQFLENTKLTAQQISGAFGVKLHQLNELVKSSYASTSESNREFYTDTMLGILTMYEQETTYKIFMTTELNNGFYGKFAADVILRGDPKTRYEAYASAIQNGVLMPDECRSMEDRPSAPGGNRLYLNGNMIPAELAGNQYGKESDPSNGT